MGISFAGIVENKKKSDLKMALDERSGDHKVIRIDPQVDMKV